MKKVLIFRSFLCPRTSSGLRKIHPPVFPWKYFPFRTFSNKQIDIANEDANELQKYVKKSEGLNAFTQHALEKISDRNAGKLFPKIIYFSAVLATFYFVYSRVFPFLFMSTPEPSKENFEETPPKIEDAISDGEFCKTQKREDFSSVIGNQEAKEQFQDIVDFLRNPEKFERVGAKMPRGILLTGPPGCGKTIMAKALAGEANVTFFFAAGSSFEEIFVGKGANRIRKLFSRARKVAPCIIFIDEFDSIGEKRSKNSTFARMLINQILSEMDGFKDNEGIVVVGATNLPERLDPALTRSGRFDRKIEVHLPDKYARKELFKQKLRRQKLAPNVDLDELASQSTGMSGADIANIANSAALESIKNNCELVTHKDLIEAISRVSLGKVRTSLHLSDNVVYNTAVHEAGHTVAALFTPSAPPINQLTIQPRGHSLGSTWYVPREGTQYSMSKDEILSLIDVAMGGHAAEEMVFGHKKATTGAASDFQNATSLAILLVAQYGMSCSIGKLSSDPRNFEEWSPFLKEKVLKEARKLTEESYERAQRLLRKHRSVVEKLAHQVIESETLSRKEIYEIAGLNID